MLKHVLLASTLFLGLSATGCLKSKTGSSSSPVMSGQPKNHGQERKEEVHERNEERKEAKDAAKEEKKDAKK